MKQQSYACPANQCRASATKSYSLLLPFTVENAAGSPQNPTNTAAN